jgi:hypothetical protein
MKGYNLSDSYNYDMSFKKKTDNEENMNTIINELSP